MRCVAPLALFVLSVCTVQAADPISATIDVKLVPTREHGRDVAKIEFSLRNTGEKVLRGCLGPTWGWAFPGSIDRDTEVVSHHRTLEFEVETGKTFEWSEALAYSDPKVWIEPVRFQVDLYKPGCKGKRRLQLETRPVTLQPGRVEAE